MGNESWPSISFRAMGADCFIAVEPGPHCDELLKRGRLEVDRFEETFSRFKAGSELSRLNASGGGLVSKEMRDLLEVALDLESRTHGLFSVALLGEIGRVGYDRDFEEIDRSGTQEIEMPEGAQTLGDPIARRPRITLDGSTLRIARGSGVDLGGVAKGWSAQRVAVLLGDDGGALVDLGGDLFAVGPGPAGGLWPIALDHGAGDICTLTIAEGATCTSSTLRRRWFLGGHEVHHIIDPRTGGAAAEELVAVSVVAKSGAGAEAMAKAAIVGGVRHGLSLLGALDADAIATSRDGVVYGVGELFAGVTETATVRVRAGGPEVGRSSANSIAPEPSVAP
ncbi:MAG: hypothetical protein DCC49_03795 [Acidobacteria bacterium]|nr:MAG: hypothetical protein DCC49_03795 [Acidobacteriota bacterium]